MKKYIADLKIKTAFYHHGKLKALGKVDGDMKEGTWKYFSENGKLEIAIKSFILLIQQILFENLHCLQPLF